MRFDRQMSQLNRRRPQVSGAARPILMDKLSLMYDGRSSIATFREQRTFWCYQFSAIIRRRSAIGTRAGIF
jgi:hypothetical protein